MPNCDICLLHSYFTSTIQSGPLRNSRALFLGWPPAKIFMVYEMFADLAARHSAEPKVKVRPNGSAKPFGQSLPNLGRNFESHSDSRMLAMLAKVARTFGPLSLR